MSIDSLVSILLLAAVMFLPAGVCFLYTGTSHSTGTALASAIVLAALVWRSPTPEALVPLMLIVALLAIHLTLALALTSDQSGRALLSIGLFSVVFLSSFTLGKWLFIRPPSVIKRTTAVLRVVMIGFAIAALLGIQPEGINEWEKPVFPFTEPSHFVLVFTPLLIDACVKSRGLRRYAWIATGYLLAFGLKNLSLAVGTTLAALVSLPLLQLAVGAIVAPLILFSANLSYFTDRLDFSARATNISTLVYIQGWELIVDSMRRSLGWGIGFQQLGYGPIRSTASEIIFQITRLELNLQDGGFVAAKLISEFGIFGMALSLCFAFIAVKCALLLRRIAGGAVFISPGRTFAVAIIVAYSIDMFIRGVAYFTASSALFLAALIYYLMWNDRPVRPAFLDTR